MFFKKKYNGVILIDFHDVLTDLQDFKLKQGNFFAKKYGYKLVNPNAYDTSEIFDWTVSRNEEFWDMYLPQLLNTFKPKHLAKEALERLSFMKYKILVAYNPNDFDLTPESQKYHIHHMSKWLDRFDIPYDNCIISEKDWLEIVQKNEVTLFISANPSSIERVSTHCPSFIFDTNYNQNVDGDRITRVHDWKEAFQKIRDKH